MPHRLDHRFRFLNIIHSVVYYCHRYLLDIGMGLIDMSQLKLTALTIGVFPVHYVSHSIQVCLRLWEL